MMKISKSLRDSYATQLPTYEHLKTCVDEYFLAFKDANWHYTSRVKELESFALKVETGRCPDIDQMEDFFACTVVVENLDSMSTAEKLVRKRFVFKERRPPKEDHTSKSPDSFRFDDTRVYVVWKDDPIVRPTGLNGRLFEVQIKTFLAHAWSIATHDLVYKADEKSWPKERIAFQIKAMLEHAETSIQEAERLAQAASLKKTDEVSLRISAIIKLMTELWPPASLPRDKKRLAQNVYALINSVGVDVDSLRKIIVRETRSGRGAKTLNLSPYCSVVQSLLSREPEKMKAYLTGRERSFKLFVPRELELPQSFQGVELRNVVQESLT